uniref:Uncharacterized protein n=1 Tax=Glossina austeni TaxID=7395 RepID=A0A1A9VQX6_GLOAU
MINVLQRKSRALTTKNCVTVLLLQCETNVNNHQHQHQHHHHTAAGCNEDYFKLKWFLIIAINFVLASKISFLISQFDYCQGLVCLCPYILPDNYNKKGENLNRRTRKDLGRRKEDLENELCDQYLKTGTVLVINPNKEKDKVLLLKNPFP